jgi:hypothetical protein
VQEIAGNEVTRMCCVGLALLLMLLQAV